jgi:L-amino acid N-acyltransferase YncA
LRRIRLAERRDGPGLAEVYAPAVTQSSISFELDAPGGDEMASRVEKTLALAPWLVLDEDGRVDGYAYASPFNERAAYVWSVNAAVYVRQGRHRSGIGRGLYTALFALLRAQGFCGVHAGITMPNEASVGLHESFGFRRVALYPKVGFKRGAWHDVGWWQLELRERTGPPALVASVDALRGSTAWSEAITAGESAIIEA